MSAQLNFPVSVAMASILALNPPSNVHPQRDRSPDLIDLRFNENPFFTSPKVIMALQDAISDSRTVSQYPDSAAPKVREQLATLYKIDKDQIVVGNGSSEIIEFVFNAFGGPGKSAILERIGFPGQKHAASITGTEMQLLDNPNLAYDLDEMLRIVNKKTSLIVLSNPGNPSGIPHKTADLRAFLQTLDPDVMVLLDEAYFEYLEGPDYEGSLGLLKEFDNLIITRTFSKAYGLAGLRFGYGMAHPKVVHMLNLLRSRVNVNRYAQIAASAALEDYEHVIKTVKNNRAGMNRMIEQFLKYDIQYYGTGANFILFRLPRTKKSGLHLFLTEHQFLIREGGISEEGFEYLRASIGLPTHTDRFCELLDFYMHQHH